MYVKSMSVSSVKVDLIPTSRDGDVLRLKKVINDWFKTDT